MDSGAIGWIIVVFIVVGLPIYLDHRQKMAKLLGAKSDPDGKLLARIEALEKKCEKLQEQVNDTSTPDRRTPNARPKACLSFARSANSFD